MQLLPSGEGGQITTGSCDRGSSKNIRIRAKKKVPASILGWSSNTIIRECGAPQFGGRDKRLGNVHRTAGLDENSVKPHDDCTCQFATTSRVLWKKQPALLVTDCTSVPDAVHKEGTAPSSTHKPLAVELAIFEITGPWKAKQTGGGSTVPDCSFVSPSAHRGSTTRDNNK